METWACGTLQVKVGQVKGGLLVPFCSGDHLSQEALFRKRELFCSNTDAVILSEGHSEKHAASTLVQT